LNLPKLFPSASQQLKRPWAFWLLFFFQYAAIGGYFTFLNVYYREAGMSGTQIGLINMATALVSVGSAVVWGFLADRTGRPRILIACGAVGGLIVAQFIPMVSTFTAFLVLGSVGSLMASAPGTLVDSTTLAMLGDRREDYARYRLGGTYGYIITASTIGFLFDRAGLQMMFPVYGLIMLVFAGVALLLPDTTVQREETSGGEMSAMMRRPTWLIFMVCVFLVWIASNASIMFTGVVLSSMGASQTLIGFAVTIGAVIEIPFMMFSPRLLRRFGSERLLLIAFGLMVIRYFLLAWMPTPEWAVPINALNGPAFVLFWNSAVTLANKMAPVGMAGTVQGLLASTMSLAGVVSALMTGMLFDQFGPNGMFLVMAFCVLAAFLLFAAANYRLLRAAAVRVPTTL
jgi:MFS transporter, PPP family, 3-phenylpropionic acid transporter